jgi:hypothetical protein
LAAGLREALRAGAGLFGLEALVLGAGGGAGRGGHLDPEL